MLRKKKNTIIAINNGQLHENATNAKIIAITIIDVDLVKKKMKHLTLNTPKFSN